MPEVCHLFGGLAVEAQSHVESTVLYIRHHWWIEDGDDAISSIFVCGPVFCERPPRGNCFCARKGPQHKLQGDNDGRVRSPVVRKTS